MKGVYREFIISNGAHGTIINNKVVGCFISRIDGCPHHVKL